MTSRETLKQPFPYSLPKEKIKILLLEGISETAVNAFKGAGYTQIDRRTKALDGADLRQALNGIRLLGIRSRTQITADVIEGIRSVVAVGCFSVGTNQVDLSACRAMGIPVLGRLNEVFAHRKVNIAAQYYETAGELGYVVLDADGTVPDAEEIVKEIRAMPGTIRARMLYRRS